MRPSFLLAALSLCAVSLCAQKPVRVNPNTVEGQQIERARAAADDAAKLAQYEQFLAAYPQHEAALWVLGQAQPLMLKAGRLDDVVRAGETILAADAEADVASYNALQACERKTDIAGIILWAGRTIAAAKRVMASPKPDSADDAALWSSEVDWARQVVLRAEYSFYATALRINDAKGIVALYEGLVKQNPLSEYMSETGGRYLVALLQMGELARAQEVCEKAAAANQANVDMLLYAADANLNVSKNYDKALDYAGRLTSSLPAAPPAMGYDATTWEPKRQASLGRAHFVAGAAAAGKADWPASEKSLRAALATVTATPALKDQLPAVQFYLGLAVYSQARAAAKPDPARLEEARRHFADCAAVTGPYQAQAQKNLAAIAPRK